MRFVSPETVRIELAEGEWIDVKKELTTEEQKNLDMAGYHRVASSEGQPEVVVKFAEKTLARVLTYVVGWSASELDKNGKKVPVKFSADAVRKLDIESFTEMDKAIEGHEEAIAAEKKAKKDSKEPILKSV